MSKLIPKNSSIRDFFDMRKLRDKIREDIPKQIAESKRKRAEDEQRIKDLINKGNKEKKKERDRKPVIPPNSGLPIRGVEEGKNGTKFSKKL